VDRSGTAARSISCGVASATLIEVGAVNVSAGATAHATLIGAGRQNVRGLAVSTLADEETTETSYCGGTALETTLGSLAEQVVSSGGLASSTIISGYATLLVSTGGSTYDLQFATSQSFAGLAFYLTPDFDNSITILLAYSTTVLSAAARQPLTSKGAKR
jgi:autotransporter passenger strand-loop-strand repeat protein